MKEFFELGDFLQGSYPRHNHEGYRTGKRVLRTFQLTEIRDLNIAPLEEQTLAATPLTCRSDILLTGVDLDSGEMRSFYLASFEGLAKIDPKEIQGKPPRVMRIKGETSTIRELPDIRESYCEAANSFPDGSVTIPIG